MFERSEIYKKVIFITEAANNPTAEAEIRASEDEIKGQIVNASKNGDKLLVESLVHELSAIHEIVGHLDRAVVGISESRLEPTFKVPFHRHPQIKSNKS